MKQITFTILLALFAMAGQAQNQDLERLSFCLTMQRYGHKKSPENSSGLYGTNFGTIRDNSGTLEKLL